MRWMSRAVVVAAVLTPTLAPASLAQRRAEALMSFTAQPTTTANKSAISPTKQQPAGTMTGPDWSLFAGIADGDNPYDIGIALGGSGRWHRSDWPVGIRGDAYFAHHSGDIGSQFGGVDLSVNIFGLMGNAEYEFEAPPKLKPYVFAGLGLFYSNVNVDYDGEFDDNVYDSSTDLGLGIGGGVHLTPKFGVEVRFMKVGEFNTIPLLAVFHF